MAIGILTVSKSIREAGLNFKVYGDFKYAIEARAWKEPSGKSARVVITDKSTNLLLVLKPD
jgi:hypothetical protein